MTPTFDLTASIPPEWIPSGMNGPLALPCGRWWDAVQVPCLESISAFVLLGRIVGPVVDDQREGLHWWLIPPGTASGWNLPHVEVLGDSRELLVPPANARPGALLWWASPPGGRLTDPGFLHAALVTVIKEAHTGGYRSPDCALSRHAMCRHGAAPRDLGYGVRAEACNCPCHTSAWGAR
ncbi:hypothetical protein [Streptomyces sp. PT12]|uniref:hypothetical protein n=1 Tax=Streptomyces sp. PT12 TaxID=1510197 RepID=UPI0011BFB30D|nr:hypothetical protein [Streptomyces sp. PT12]